MTCRHRELYNIRLSDSILVDKPREIVAIDYNDLCVQCDYFDVYR